jgi:hypothetical protein
MKRLGLFLTVIAAACGDDASSPPDARPPADAAAPDGAVADASSIDATPDVADASAADAPSPDATVLPDAGPVDDCPNRTAPRGEPQGPIPPEAIRSGDVTIRSALDVVALTGIRAITGNVTVDGPPFTTLSLPDLEVVGGRFRTASGAPGTITVLDLPNLETVGGDIGLLGTLISVSAPRLEQTGGTGFAAAAIDLHCLRDTLGTRLSGYAGTTLPLPRYRTGTLTITQAPNLTRLDVPQWISGGLAVEDTAALTTIAAPLNPASSIDILRAPLLTSIDLAPITTLSSMTLTVTAIADLSFLEGLTRVNGGLTLTATRVTSLAALDGVTSAVSVALTNNPVLASMSGLSNLTFTSSLWVNGNPMLTTVGLARVPTLDGGLQIVSNHALTTLAFPALTRVVYEFVVRDNPAMPNCQATDLRARVAGAPDTTIDGNGTGVCP